MAKLATLLDDGWKLECGESRHKETPDTFSIPERKLRESLEPEEIVKLIFRIVLVDAEGNKSEEVERMWVSVKGRIGRFYRGELDNDPYCTDEIAAGMEVFFEPRHVVQIYETDDAV